uniref:Uncharacterized protein n=1 Tax=Zea mays TaxID=4577 RepID=A0A804QK43_MAIZE
MPLVTPTQPPPDLPLSYINGFIPTHPLPIWLLAARGDSLRLCDGTARDKVQRVVPPRAASCWEPSLHRDPGVEIRLVLDIVDEINLIDTFFCYLGGNARLFDDYRDEDYYVLPRKFSIVARVEVKFPIEPRYRDRQHFILSDINGAKIETMTSSYETVKHFNNLLHEKHVFKMHNVDFSISMGAHQFRHISGPMELYLTRQTVVEPYTVPFQMPPFPKHIFLSLADIAELPNRTLVDIMAIVVHLDIIHRTMWGPFRKIVVMDARWSLHAIKVWGDLLNKNALRWVLAKENCSIIIGTMFRRFRRQECLESSDYTTIHFNPFHHNNHHFEPIQKALMAWNDRQFAVRFLEEQRRR